MSFLSHLSNLKERLPSSCRVLTDPDDPSFVESMQRWTDIDLQIPGAIVLPTSEDDCQKIVKWTHQNSVPFVTKSGAHSAWSTIGKEGIVIDLKLYKGIEVDVKSKTSRLTGSILSKEVGVELANAGLFTALGNGNTVGAIPYFLGGGQPVTPSITGLGSDQIISARMILADGDLIDVREETYPDLLYAVRGAGQFFGLVTQLVIKCYDLTQLGNEEGVVWSGIFVFPFSQAREVTTMMKHLMDDDTYSTSGLIMISAPPPARKPALVIAAKYLGLPANAGLAFKSLQDMRPILMKGGPVPIQDISDAQNPLGIKGGFKRFGIVGLAEFDQEAFLKIVDLWAEMLAECPDAINTSFNFKWDSRNVRQPDFESAMCLHDTRYLLNNIIWHTDPRNRSKIDEYNNKCIAIMRGNKEETFIDFQNCVREGPIERRFRGEERLCKLMSLKKQWDPTGVFTKQLLKWVYI